MAQVRTAHTKPRTPAPSGHADIGGVAAGSTRQVLFADAPGGYAVGAGECAEDCMDEGASELPLAARGSVRGPGAASGQATTAVSDNTKKRKPYTALHHKLLENVLLSSAVRARMLDARTMCWMSKKCRWNGYRSFARVHPTSLLYMVRTGLCMLGKSFPITCLRSCLIRNLQTATASGC